MIASGSERVNRVTWVESSQVLLLPAQDVVGQLKADHSFFSAQQTVTMDSSSPSNSQFQYTLQSASSSNLNRTTTFFPMMLMVQLNGTTDWVHSSELLFLKLLGYIDCSFIYLFSLIVGENICRFLGMEAGSHWAVLIVPLTIADHSNDNHLMSSLSLCSLELGVLYSNTHTQDGHCLLGLVLTTFGALNSRFDRL